MAAPPLPPGASIGRGVAAAGAAKPPRGGWLTVLSVGVVAAGSAAAGTTEGVVQQGQRWAAGLTQHGSSSVTGLLASGMAGVPAFEAAARAAGGAAARGARALRGANGSNSGGGGGRASSTADATATSTYGRWLRLPWASRGLRTGGDRRQGATERAGAAAAAAAGAPAAAAAAGRAAGAGAGAGGAAAVSVAATASGRVQRHWEGLLASSVAPMFAVCMTNPAEVTKVRMQMFGELQRQGKLGGPPPTYLGTLLRTFRTQGISGLQAGLSVAVMREGTKNIFRIGCYDPILATIHGGDRDPKTAPVWKRMLAGATSGTVAAVSCNPVDIVKTRMQGRGVGTKAGTANYGTVWEAIRSLPRDEGVRGMYAGAEASAARSSINTAVNLTTYTMVKEALVASKLLGEEGTVVHLASALASAGAGCAVTHPLDVMRTRLYMQPKDASGRGKLYSGLLDCVTKVARKEGFRGFYKGFQAHFMRIGPHLVLTFFMLEKFKAGMRHWEPVRSYYE